MLTSSRPASTVWLLAAIQRDARRAGISQLENPSPPNMREGSNMRTAPVHAERGVDRLEFDQTVASRGWDDGDERWPLATYFLAWLSDLEDIESGRYGDQPECVAASKAALDLVLEIQFAFDSPRANGEKFHSYAVCLDRLEIITQNLKAHLAHDGTVD
jgi:hypothetical protein